MPLVRSAARTTYERVVAWLLGQVDQGGHLGLTPDKTKNVTTNNIYMDIFIYIFFWGGETLKLGRNRESRVCVRVLPI